MTRNVKKGTTRGTWEFMVRSCTDPGHIAFKYYGAKGVLVCARWMIYENFLEDMRERPSPMHYLLRNNRAKGYSPENCRWTSAPEEKGLKKSNRRIVFHGRDMTLSQWGRFLGISRRTLFKRFTMAKSNPGRWPLNKILGPWPEGVPYVEKPNV